GPNVNDMDSRFKVIVFTHILSSCQVELFNAIARWSDISLCVGYLYKSRVHRLWKMPDIAHDHCWLDDDSRRYEKAENLMADADLVVFNYYQNSQILELSKE